jgi:hypothetical protein
VFCKEFMVKTVTKTVTQHTAQTPWSRASRPRLESCARHASCGYSNTRKQAVFIGGSLHGKSSSVITAIAEHLRLHVCYRLFSSSRAL